jgi:hypothetical protein
MTVALNNYASKAYSEHPIALWPLDDPVYYISLISNSERYFTSWTLDNFNADDNPSIPDTGSPFDDNLYSSLIVNTTDAVVASAKSPGLFSGLEIDLDTPSFSVNFFVYQKPDFVKSYRVGYEYTDLDSVVQKVYKEKVFPPEIESWINLNYDFDLPSNWIGDISLIIEIDMEDTSSTDISARTFIFNGLSVGQNSQISCYENLGVIPQQIPSELGFFGITGILADQYGLLTNGGYYLVRNNKLLAKNDSSPIIFGTDNATLINPSGSEIPSFIFPGMGMLNESGRNKEYTFEMWMQIDPSTNSSRKIIGPISSSDGIYVKEGFISLVIGNNIASHPVSEWYRPMLIHLILKNKNAVLMINSEEVISIPIDRATMQLPQEKDWWGIYSYQSFKFFKIDCVSIYPYSISEIVAKRRFVWGQGVDSSQFIDNSFKGTPISIDFSSSEYNQNIMYPDFYRWDSGYFDNLIATKDYISVPDYRLPNIFLSERDIFGWYEDNYELYLSEYPNRDYPTSLTFRPNDSWTEQCYYNFPSLNILNDSLSAIYGVFQVDSDISSSRPIMKFNNVITGDYFDILVESQTIKYLINNNEIYSESINLEEPFTVGINVQDISLEYGFEVSRFFSSPSSVQLYVGGDGTSTFEGKIYRVGFCNQTNYSNISEYFNSSGIAKVDFYELFIDNFASYTLIPEIEYGKMFLDISVFSRWEEYYPLSYFASIFKNQENNDIYGLDSLQINLGYPTVSTDVVWTYLELLQNFSGQDYEDLANENYINYLSLKKNNSTGNIVDTSFSSLQGYLTFTDISNSEVKPVSEFPYTKQLSSNMIIDVDEENSLDIPDKGIQTKFLFSDNVIVFPPTNVDIENLYMSINLEIEQRSIIRNPLKIKRLEISSKTFNKTNESTPNIPKNFIGTKYGTRVYPYVFSNGQKEYGQKNAISIYKSSSPYIYTTSKSGIRVINKKENDLEYGVEIPINQSGANQFEISALQMWMLRKEEGQQYDDLEIMSIQEKDNLIVFVAQTEGEDVTVDAYYTTGDPFIIEGGNALSTEDLIIEGGSASTVPSEFLEGGNASIGKRVNIPGLSLYQNGKFVSKIRLRKNEWSCIGVSFNTPLDFNSFAGNINLFGDITYNNMSYYLTEGLEGKVDILSRNWSGVLEFDGIERVWSFWSENDKTWKFVYVLGGQASYAITPKDIFDVYSGTNRKVIDDNKGVFVQQTESSYYSDVVWSNYLGKPA